MAHHLGKIFLQFTKAWTAYFGDRYVQTREVPNLDGRPFFCHSEFSKEKLNFHGRKVSVFKDAGIIHFETYFDGLREDGNFLIFDVTKGLISVGTNALKNRRVTNLLI